MEALWLLAKINVVFQIAEKVIYGALGLYGVSIGGRYIKDYRNSVEEEKLMKGGRI